jgi:hypothetical protein
MRLARRTIATATDDPEVLWMVGWSLAYLAAENTAGMTLTQLTLGLDCDHVGLRPRIRHESAACHRRGRGRGNGGRAGSCKRA